MSNVEAEHRVHRRVEFFLMPADSEHVPVWVFQPADVPQAQLGLVLNLSDGGIQVLTAAEAPLEAASYEIQLLIGDDDAVPRFRGSATRIWTRSADVVGNLSGLRFDELESSAEQFIRTFQSTARARRWVRCILAAR